MIAKAENLLGHRLPEQLKKLFFDFNGFLGPTAASFLFPILDRPRPGAESLVTFTQFFRSEDYFPDWLKQAVAIGGNGTGTTWFILLDANESVVQWDAEWEEYEPIEGNLLDAWMAEKKLYDVNQFDIKIE